MTTDAGSGFDDQAAGRDAAANLDEIKEQSRRLAGDEIGDGPAEDDEEDREEDERKRVQDEVNEAFGDGTF
jgi:hypothetical protein